MKKFIIIMIVVICLIPLIRWNNSQIHRRVDKEKIEEYRYRENCAEKHELCLGMTYEQVILSKGKPDHINRTVGRWGVHEQWVYSWGNIYFENEILTAWQD